VINMLTSIQITAFAQGNPKLNRCLQELKSVVLSQLRLTEVEKNRVRKEVKVGKRLGVMLDLMLRKSQIHIRPPRQIGNLYNRYRGLSKGLDELMKSNEVSVQAVKNDGVPTRKSHIKSIILSIPYRYVLIMYSLLSTSIILTILIYTCRYSCIDFTRRGSVSVMTISDGLDRNTRNFSKEVGISCIDFGFNREVLSLSFTYFKLVAVSRDAMLPHFQWFKISKTKRGEIGTISPR